MGHWLILKVGATVKVGARRSGNNGSEGKLGERGTKNAKNAASGEYASLFALKSAPPSRPLKSAAA
ncbi:MAG: hypothetical protein IKK39_11935 [Thermoguttaceae bacterium]|nr:hypothetical protein [Thermoguttaceae bacterium]MBR4104757.1 hypothetical protein [Thermoguttaceae bacterium]